MVYCSLVDSEIVYIQKGVWGELTNCIKNSIAVLSLQASQSMAYENATIMLTGEVNDVELIDYTISYSGTGATVMLRIGSDATMSIIVKYV